LNLELLSFFRTSEQLVDMFLYEKFVKKNQQQKFIEIVTQKLKKVPEKKNILRINGIK